MKKQGVLLLILAMLVAVVFLQRQQQQKLVTSAPADSIRLDPERVSRIQIQRPGEPLVELARIGGGWRIRQPFEYAAQDQTVQSVLTSLKDLELKDVVSTNPEKRGRFQVDSTGTQVQAWEADTPVLSLVIGKATPDFSHTYVRHIDGDEVYRAVGMLTYNFTKKPDDWRDKTILNLDPASIAKVQLRYPKEDVVLELSRADSLWTVSANGAAAAVADSATVANLLNSTAHLSTASFASEAEWTGKDRADVDFELHVQTDSGEHQVSFVKGENNRYLAKLQGTTGVVFSLYEGNLTNIQKKAEDFQGEAS